MIMHLMIYIQCQHSVQMQEVMWAKCSKAEMNEGVEIRMVDGPVASTTFTKESRVCVSHTRK